MINRTKLSVIAVSAVLFLNKHILSDLHQDISDQEFVISRCKLLYRMDKQQIPTVQHRKLYSIC